MSKTDKATDKARTVMFWDCGCPPTGLVNLRTGEVIEALYPHIRGSDLDHCHVCGVLQKDSLPSLVSEVLAASVLRRHECEYWVVCKHCEWNALRQPGPCPVCHGEGICRLSDDEINYGCCDVLPVVSRARHKESKE